MVKALQDLKMDDRIPYGFSRLLRLLLRAKRILCTD